MRTTLRIGVAVLAGLFFGIALVIACGGGPPKASAQSPITCDVPPVTCTVPPVTCNTPGQVRSAVAGTWNVAISKPGTGTICPSGALHLSGSDSALTGAWACNTNMSGVVTGDLVAGRLRLNLQNESGTFLLLDAPLAAGGQSATGTGVGYSGIGFATDYAVTLTAQP
jgi:hypothetical protein